MKIDFHWNISFDCFQVPLKYEMTWSLLWKSITLDRYFWRKDRNPFSSASKSYNYHILCHHKFMENFFLIRRKFLQNLWEIPQTLQDECKWIASGGDFWTVSTNSFRFAWKLIPKLPSWIMMGMHKIWDDISPSNALNSYALKF